MWPACIGNGGTDHDALMNILRSGDHVVAAAGLYGGTVELLDELQAYGITYHLCARRIHRRLFRKRRSRPQTRAVFAETIGNPKLDVTDIQGRGRGCT